MGSSGSVESVKSVDSMYRELKCTDEQRNNAANGILERDVLPILVEAVRSGKCVTIEKESYPVKLEWNSLRQNNCKNVNVPDWVFDRIPYTCFYEKVKQFFPAIVKS